ncbi:ABC transporter ATP-binding protein, partial [Kitasatospora sp. NPDC093806]
MEVHRPPSPQTPRSTPVTTSTATAVRTGRAAARATGLNKVYGEGETRVVALDNV